MMKRTQVEIQLEDFPSQFHGLLQDSNVFDSSSSPEARVWFIDRAEGFFLKSASRGALGKEAAMTDFFHRKGSSAEMMVYISEERDWLLTRRLPGEDCLDPWYLEDPEWLCDTTAQLLRQLHDTNATDCPVDRTIDYTDMAKANYLLGHYDTSLFPDNWGYACAEDAWKVVCEAAPALRHDTLLHGDYCLPNIILKDGAVSGFNLKTDRWTERFLDVYGRDLIQPELLAAIGAFEVFL